MRLKRRITKVLAYMLKYLSKNCLLAVNDDDGSFLVTKGNRPMGFVTSLEGRFVFIAGSITQSKKGDFLDIRYYLQSKGAYILDPLATYDSRYSTLSYKNYMVLALAMIQCAVMERINGRRIHENRRVYHYFEGDVLRPQR